MNPSKSEPWSSAPNPSAASTAHPDQSRPANPNFGPLPSPKTLPAPASLGPNAPILPPPTSLFNSPNAPPQPPSRFPPSPFAHPQPLEPRNLSQEQVSLPPPPSMSGPPFALSAGAPRYAAPEAEKEAKQEPREITAMDEVARRQVELQREPRERAPGDSQVLHQPVALAPSVRTVHGPNGILGGQGPPLPHVHGGSHPLFPISHQQRSSGQPPQPMLVPFNPNIQPPALLNPPPMSSGPIGQGMRDGPMRDGPMRDGPMREGPMRDGPMRDGPMRDAPISQGQIHTPMSQSPMNHGSMNQSPMNHAPMSQPPLNQSQQSQSHNHVGQGQNQTQQNQPILNDALSYLDQVKLQFNDHPNVYNRFLDIMKEFKSGIIDTPGVIDRVAQLFTGHPNLIQGFNTFLPPGYRIECGLGDDPNSIRVTTPMGTISATLQGRPPSNPRSHRAGPGEHQPPPPQSQSQPPAERPYLDGRPSWVAGHDHQFQESRLTLPPPPGHNPNLAPALDLPREPVPTTLAPDSQAMMHRVTLAPQIAPIRSVVGQAPPGEALPPMAGGNVVNGVVAPPPTAPGGAVEKRGPVEFNHAISYVNKIKNRFAQQPDTYKQFLEILQTYQRESRPIGDVYSQVTRLFETAPDLLEDFKQFLPESAAHANALRARDEFATSNVRGDVGYSAAAQAASQTPRAADQLRLPPMGNFTPTPSKENKRKRGGPAPAVGVQYVPGPHVNKRQKQTHAVVKQPVVQEIAEVAPSLIPPVPGPLEVALQPSQEDMVMYERVKKIINNKTIFTEFIKLLNCYNQDMGSPAWVLERCALFVNNDAQVMNWLTTLLGRDDERINNEPRQLTMKPDLARCRAFGLSYRALPNQDRNALCSGRDELCREVLNDVWASHPTWDSEETGFVAHKKTAYEENLHRIEEERHDYDSNIECLVRTIQLLEPICRTLQTLEKPELFQTDSKLGGQSEFIYKRTIYKLYGREMGEKVIELLHKQPYIVCPILLHRLKETREKWKAGQRQWYEVWRTQTSANYHKSLDIQGSIKSGDKRIFQPKGLQQEIRIKREEQRNKAARGIPQPLGLLRKDYQYAYRFSNDEVLHDACRLVLAQFNGRRPNAQESQPLFNRVKEILALFLSVDINDLRGYIEDWDDVATVQKNIGKTKSLLHAVLSKEGDVTPATGANTPVGHSGLEDGYATPLLEEHDDSPIKSWFKLQPMRIGQPASPAGNSDGGAQAVEGAEREISPDEEIERSEYHMYCNNTMYNFFRLFAMLYERLELLHGYEKEVRALVNVQKLKKPAHELNLIDHAVGENPYFEDVSPTASFYRQTINKFEDYIFVQDSDMQTHIEELLRRYYLPFGWQMYHLERLLGGMDKMANLMFTTDKERLSEQLIQLFRKDRVKERASLMEDLSYKKQAFKYLGAKEKDGETSYRITYVISTKTMLIQLFDKDSPIFDDSTRDHHRRWQQYMTSFASLEPTDGVSDAVMRARLPVLWAHASKSESDGRAKAAGHGGHSSGSSNSGSAALAVDELGAPTAIPSGDGASTMPALLTRSLGFAVAFDTYELQFQPDTEEGIVSGELAWSGRFLGRASEARGAAGAAVLAELGAERGIERAVARPDASVDNADKSGEMDVDMSGTIDKPDETMGDAAEQTAPVAVPAVVDATPEIASVAAVAPVAESALVAETVPAVENATGDAVVESTPVARSPSAGGNAAAATENPTVDGNTTGEPAGDVAPAPAVSPAAGKDAASPKAPEAGAVPTTESAPAEQDAPAREKSPVAKKQADEAPAAKEAQVAPGSPVGNGDAPEVKSEEVDAADEAVMTSARLPEPQEEASKADEAVAPTVAEQAPSANGEKEVDGDVEMGGIE